ATDNAVIDALRASRDRVASARIGTQQAAMREEAERLAGDFDADTLPDGAIVEALLTPTSNVCVAAVDAQNAVRDGIRAARHATSPGGVEEPWPDPMPFGAFQLPLFPLDTLPLSLRQWVTAEAEETQTSPELPAMLALAVASAAIAKKFEVQVRAKWSESVN